MYADDIALIAPTTTYLKMMLSICDSFRKEFDVIFNTDKNQLLYYGSSYNDIPLKKIQ